MTGRAAADWFDRAFTSSRGSWHATWHEIFGACESPIESELAECLRVIAADRHYELLPAAAAAGRREVRAGIPHRQFRLMAQRWIGTYRVDFLILGTAGLIPGSTTREFKAVVVECDGAEWHGTPEQRERDAARDAALRRLGLTVLRFSGAEIRHAGEACAAEIFRCFDPPRPPRWEEGEEGDGDEGELEEYDP